MKKYFNVSILALSLFLSLNLYATPVKVSSSLGMKIMEKAIENKSAINYIKSAEHFAPQKNLLFCGPASVAIVLNTMGVKRPYS